METAGAEDMPDDAERKGLGTPATRAAILEKLVKTGFVERKGGGKNIVLLAELDAALNMEADDAQKNSREEAGKDEEQNMDDELETDEEDSFHDSLSDKEACREDEAAPSAVRTKKSMIMEER